MSDGLAPAEAVDRFLQRRETDATERTLRSYEARLGHFVDFCADRGIEDVAAIDGRTIEEFGLTRRQTGNAPATIKGELSTLRVFLQYLDDVGYVEGLADAVEVPSLSRTEEASDERLEPAEAERLLSFFRDSRAHFGTSNHAILELLWHTGCRIGGARALDLSDYDPEDQSLAFRHRPREGTPLKNGVEGERLVGLSADVVEALDVYVARERSDRRDEYGREPLFCGRQGRPSFATIRAWTYLATQPCLYRDCPHGRERSTCSYVDRNHASKCPSSRSPHRIRTGSITWQLNRGLDIEQVAARVNASPAVIRKHYDAASEREAFEERRRDAAAALDVTESDHE